MQQTFLNFGEGGFPATENAGAEFSADRKFRYALWRIWDAGKPLTCFIGLNPSTANETELDATVRRVVNFAKLWNFGGVYMMNCFPYVSTDPKGLNDFGGGDMNDQWLRKVGAICQTVYFAWGSFKIVKETGRDIQLSHMFPEAMALAINKDGSPKHPLYVAGNITPVNYELPNITTNGK